MRYVALVLAVLALPAKVLPAQALPAEASCVVLLHGLARSASSMEPMAAFLKSHGFQAVNIDYPSTEYPIATLADMAVRTGVSQCGDAGQIHFVTHSMGGILVRQYLSVSTLPKLGRVVMLGPPNGGSEVVDELGEFPGFEWLNGEAGLQLGTGPNSIPNQLGPANFDLGIIAGTRSINLILSTLIPGVDDGKVSVESARLQGMSDFLTVPATHPLMMKDEEVMRQTLHFLEQGRFDHPEVQRW